MTGALVALALAAAAPVVDQSVVYRSGVVHTDRVRASAATVDVSGRRCAVPAATPLAALLRSRVLRVRVRDFGSCSRRAADAGGLFVSAIGPDRNRGNDGWVYKVGTRLGTAGAADPSGPFGRGRLRGGRVTWFYCRFDERENSCQRTLLFTVHRFEDGGLRVRLRSHDDEGRARAAPGVEVLADGLVSETTDAEGYAHLTLSSGRHTITARKTGLIPPPALKVVAP